MCNYSTRWRPSVKELSLDEDFQKLAATFPLIKFYGMSLISAGSITLDSTCTFKRNYSRYTAQKEDDGDIFRCTSVQVDREGRELYTSSQEFR
jgi:hypothetical protein